MSHQCAIMRVVRDPGAGGYRPGAWPILRGRTDVAHRIPPQRVDKRSSDDIWASNLWQHYGMRPADYLALMRAQDSRCAICGVHNQDARTKGGGRPRRAGGPPTERFRLAVDHCHRTNAVRGLLCHDCNRGLGCFQDSIAKMERAISYLRRLRVEQVPLEELIKPAVKAPAAGNSDVATEDTLW